MMTFKSNVDYATKMGRVAAQFAITEVLMPCEQALSSTE